jgi:histidinol-phosphate aminotransferase
MQFVEKLIPPYPIPDCSAKIVLKALSKRGINIAMTNTQTVIATREAFVSSIQHLGWIETIYPSATNFVLIRTKQGIDLFNYLKNHGIVTRNQTHEPALQHCVRLTVGSFESMQEVADLLCQYPQTTH